MFRSFIKVTGWEKDILAKMKKKFEKKDREIKKKQKHLEK